VSQSIVRGKGQITIPAEVRAAAQLEEGDAVEVEVVAEGILLRPYKRVDATQTWFWMPDWQQGEREAAKDLAEGRGRVFESSEEFLDSLEE